MLWINSFIIINSPTTLAAKLDVVVNLGVSSRYVLSMIAVQNGYPAQFLTAITILLKPRYFCFSKQSKGELRIDSRCYCSLRIYILLLRTVYTGLRRRLK